MSDAARGDSDGASCFISLIDLRSEFQPDDVKPLWGEIEPVLKRLAENQEDFDADRVIYGSFRAQIHDIATRGFAMSFDTTTPEIVPDDATIESLSRFSSARPLTLAAAAQVFRNSGIEGVSATSTKEDILRACGPPDRTGGWRAERAKEYLEWIRYERKDYTIWFGWYGDRSCDVIIMHPNDDEILRRHK